MAVTLEELGERLDEIDKVLADPECPDGTRRYLVGERPGLVEAYRAALAETGNIAGLVDHDIADLYEEESRREQTEGFAAYIQELLQLIAPYEGSGPRVYRIRGYAQATRNTPLGMRFKGDVLFDPKPIDTVDISHIPDQYKSQLRKMLNNSPGPTREMKFVKAGTQTTYGHGEWEDDAIPQPVWDAAISHALKEAKRRAGPSRVARLKAKPKLPPHHPERIRSTIRSWRRVPSAHLARVRKAVRAGQPEPKMKLPYYSNDETAILHYAQEHKLQSDYVHHVYHGLPGEPPHPRMPKPTKPKPLATLTIKKQWRAAKDPAGEMAQQWVADGRFNTIEEALAAANAVLGSTSGRGRGGGGGRRNPPAPPTGGQSPMGGMGEPEPDDREWLKRFAGKSAGFGTLGGGPPSSRLLEQIAAHQQQVRAASERLAVAQLESQSAIARQAGIAARARSHVEQMGKVPLMLPAFGGTFKAGTGVTPLGAYAESTVTARTANQSAFQQSHAQAMGYGLTPQDLGFGGGAAGGGGAPPTGGQGPVGAGAGGPGWFSRRGWNVQNVQAMAGRFLPKQIGLFGAYFLARRIQDDAAHIQQNVQKMWMAIADGASKFMSGAGAMAGSIAFALIEPIAKAMGKSGVGATRIAKGLYDLLVDGVRAGAALLGGAAKLFITAFGAAVGIAAIGSGAAIGAALGFAFGPGAMIAGGLVGALIVGGIVKHFTGAGRAVSEGIFGALGSVGHVLGSVGKAFAETFKGINEIIEDVIGTFGKFVDAAKKVEFGLGRGGGEFVRASRAFGLGDNVAEKLADPITRAKLTGMGIDTSSAASMMKGVRGQFAGMDPVARKSIMGALGISELAPLTTMNQTAFNIRAASAGRPSQTTQAGIEAMETFQARMQSLADTVDDVKMIFGQTLLPALQSFADKTQRWASMNMDKVVDFFTDTLPTKLGQGITWLLDTIGKALGLLYPIINPYLDIAKSGGLKPGEFGPPQPGYGGAMTAAGMAAGDLFGPVFDTLAEKIGIGIKSAWDSIDFEKTGELLGQGFMKSFSLAGSLFGGAMGMTDKQVQERRDAWEKQTPEQKKNQYKDLQGRYGFGGVTPEGGMFAPPRSGTGTIAAPGEEERLPRWLGEGGTALTTARLNAARSRVSKMFPDFAKVPVNLMGQKEFMKAGGTTAAQGSGAFAQSGAISIKDQQSMSDRGLLWTLLHEYGHVLQPNSFLGRDWREEMKLPHGKRAGEIDASNFANKAYNRLTTAEKKAAANAGGIAGGWDMPSSAGKPSKEYQDQKDKNDRLMAEYEKAHPAGAQGRPWDEREYQARSGTNKRMQAEYEKTHPRQPSEDELYQKLSGQIGPLSKHDQEWMNAIDFSRKHGSRRPTDGLGGTPVYGGGFGDLHVAEDKAAQLAGMNPWQRSFQEMREGSLDPTLKELIDSMKSLGEQLKNHGIELKIKTDPTSRFLHEIQQSHSANQLLKITRQSF